MVKFSIFFAVLKPSYVCCCQLKNKGSSVAVSYSRLVRTVSFDTEE